MFKIEADYQSLYEVIEKMRLAKSSDFLIELSQTTPFLENLLSFKILKAEAKDLGRKIVFLSKDGKLTRFTQVLNDGAESLGFVKDFDVQSLVAPIISKKVKPLEHLLIHLKSRFSWRRSIWSSGAGLALLVALIFLLIFYYLPKATITLTVEAESLVKSLDVIASPSAQQIDIVRRVIPALEITATAQKTLSTAATGSKEIGDKAKGELTIYNKTGTARTFGAKTTLSKGRTQGSDLLYLTDSEILVPSSSAETSGIATVSATAEKIGEEYNISSNATLTVANLSTNSFIAENTQNFSGGSRRAVTVVTEEDQQKLASSVQTELEGSLTNEIKSKLINDQRLDEGSFSFVIISKNFDKSVAEEASAFNLVMEEKASALAYSEADLRSLLNDSLKNYVPESYEIFGDDQSFEVVSTKFKEGNLFLVTKVKGLIVPKINDESVKNSVAGLSLYEARRHLDSLSNISSYQVTISPNLPWLTFIPRNKKSIEVTTISQ